MSLKPESNPDAALRHGVTNYFLQAIVLELLIKCIYEVDIQEKAPYSHDLTDLYGQLNADTRAEISQYYEEARNRNKRYYDSHNITEVTFHPLEKVLANNYSIVRDFKYDAMGKDSNSSVDMVFIQQLFEFINRKVSQISND